MNSWVLFDLGAQVEELYGANRMIVVYFVSTVCGFFLSTLWSPALSVGSSAGIFGLIGAMIALGVTAQKRAGRCTFAAYTRWAVYGLLFGLPSSEWITRRTSAGWRLDSSWGMWQGCRGSPLESQRNYGGRWPQSVYC